MSSGWNRLTFAQSFLTAVWGNVHSRLLPARGRLRTRKPLGPARLGGSLTALAIAFLFAANGCRQSEPPNVILVITDDQGYGDLGSHGNPVIRTPSLDKFARNSVELTNFYVSPVCAPTRASLMTGRYNYRTGVVDTYLGRALMHPDETTLAELLASAGYRTGIFGKWHLGDNYPLRPQDQGFQHTLVHRGGGIGQPSDPPGNSYFDPLLLQNGNDVRGAGYCTDVFFESALAFIEQNRDHPFFAYIATNAPHTPLQVPEEWVKPYLEDGLDEVTARVYAMVTNIDDNFNRLLSRLRQLDLEENSIVIFLTDNGHQQDRYSAGLRGRKASVYEGGIRVPFFIRWPVAIPPGRKIDKAAAHIDLLPTLAEACGIALPSDLRIDGRSLLPLLEGREEPLPDRYLYFQSHRGDVPERGRACAVRGTRFKALQPWGWSNPEPLREGIPWELYDLREDPGEQNDLASTQPALLDEMRQVYDDWFSDVASSRGFGPPRIVVGSDAENPVILTRQDWRGPLAGWSNDSLGHWEIAVERAGPYDVGLRFKGSTQVRTASFRFAGTTRQVSVPAGAEEIVLEGIELSVSAGRLEAILAEGAREVGVDYVVLATSGSGSPDGITKGAHNDHE